MELTMKDLKNSFYRTLNLDIESKVILKWYRSVIKEIANNADKQDKKKEKANG
jgi:hypothetical protein